MAVETRSVDGVKPAVMAITNKGVDCRVGEAPIVTVGVGAGLAAGINALRVLRPRGLFRRAYGTTARAGDASGIAAASRHCEQSLGVRGRRSRGPCREALGDGGQSSKRRNLSNRPKNRTVRIRTSRASRGWVGTVFSQKVRMP